MGEAYAFKTSSTPTRRASRRAVKPSVADGIAFAAAPTFAVLAGLTLVLDTGPPDVLCAITQYASPLNGMVLMYALMSVFHSTPWVKLITGTGDGTGTQSARPTSISE